MTPLETELTMEYITQREFDTRMDDLNKSINMQFKHIEESTRLARESMERRLNTMNEFRETLKDQSSQFISETTFDVHNRRIVDDIRTLREWMNKQEGRATQKSVNIVYVLSLIALLISLFDIIMRL